LCEIWRYGIHNFGDGVSEGVDGIVFQGVNESAEELVSTGDGEGGRKFGTIRAVKRIFLLFAFWTMVGVALYDVIFTIIAKR
jgi:hypothetical protein